MENVIRWICIIISDNDAVPESRPPPPSNQHIPMVMRKNPHEYINLMSLHIFMKVLLLRAFS